MTGYEIITGLLSLGALIVSILAFIKANKASSASLEIQINERITHTKEKVAEYSEKIMSLTGKRKKSKDDETLIQNLRPLLNAAIENNLNAYEEACAKYIDNKVDRKRFYKTYRTEIRQLVETKKLKSYFDAVSSRYEAILKVYREWENLED